jgi:hypothetical protein
MISDIRKRVSVNQAIAPAVLTTAATALDVDCSAYESVLCILQAGTQAGTSTTFTIQESDDDGAGAPAAYTTVADADLTGGAALAAITTANDAQNHIRGYIGTKKWVTIDLTANTAGNIDASAVIILANGRHLT